MGFGGEVDMTYSSNLGELAQEIVDLGVEWGVGGEPVAMTCDMDIGSVRIDPVDVIGRFWWRHCSGFCAGIKVLFDHQARYGMLE